MRALSTHRLQRRYTMRPTKLNIRLLIILVVFILAVVRVGWWFIRQDEGFKFVELLDEEYNDVSESDETQDSNVGVGGTLGEEKSEREVDYEFDERNSDFDETKIGVKTNNNSEEYYYDASAGKGEEIRKEWSVDSKENIETSLKNNTTRFASPVAGSIAVNKTDNFSRNMTVREDDFESDYDGSEATLDDVDVTNGDGRNDTLERELFDEGGNQVAMETAEHGDVNKLQNQQLTARNGDPIQNGQI